MEDGTIISITPNVSIYEMNLSKDYTFTLSFTSEETMDDILKSSESINIKFVFNEDPSDIYEYVTSYILVE